MMLSTHVHHLQTSISELIQLRNSFIVLSCRSCTQKRSQYVPLKLACINKEYMVLLNIMSFRHLHMAQHNAATPPLLSFSSYHLDYVANSQTYEKLT
jgi:hypothetical protein